MICQNTKFPEIIKPTLSYLPVFFLAALIISNPSTLLAQQSEVNGPLPFLESEPADKAPVEVLVLGTFHFKNVPEFNAIKAPEQQKEIKALVNKVAGFNPDKIALEFERKDSTTVDSLYRAYINGSHELTVNERQQIGFRLAGNLDHEQIYAIDYQKPWGMKAVMKWAKKNNPEFMEYVRSWQKESHRMDSLLHRDKTIGEIISLYSKESFLERIQKIRMRTLEVGADQNYIGVDPVASVYKRNMRIFANITAIAEPGDRVLIVYGGGHSYFFNEFIKQHPNMELVETDTYL